MPPINGFSDIFSINNWTFNITQGQILTNSAPTSVTLVSGNYGIPIGGAYDRMNIQITSPGSITFSYNISTADSSLYYDSFGYSLNSSDIVLENSTSRTSSSGTITVNVLKNDVFGFFVYTFDNMRGPSTTIINNFIFTPLPLPIITNFSIPTKIYGDAPFQITAPTSNSSGSFSYTSSNTSVATVSGSNITIVGAGSTMITATQASTSNYDTGSITATLIVKGYSTINVTLKDGNNNTITPSNNIYTVVFNKNKIPRMDKLTLTSSSNNNASALSSFVQSGNSLVQYSSNGDIRLVNNGTVTIKVSQGETSNYVATEKTITLYITRIAIQGRRPAFLNGL